MVELFRFRKIVNVECNPGKHQILREWPKRKIIIEETEDSTQSGILNLALIYLPASHTPLQSQRAIKPDLGSRVLRKC